MVEEVCALLRSSLSPTKPTKPTKVPSKKTIQTKAPSKKTIQDSFHEASTRRAYETYQKQFLAFLQSNKNSY